MKIEGIKENWTNGRGISKQEIDFLLSELDRAREEIEAAKHEALSLANSLYRQYYREDAPQWEPLDTPAGIISQVDNMVAGLCQKLQAAESRITSARTEAARECAEIAGNHQPQEFDDGCGTGRFIARTIRARFGLEEG